MSDKRCNAGPVSAVKWASISFITLAGCGLLFPLSAAAQTPPAESVSPPATEPATPPVPAPDQGEPAGAAQEEAAIGAAPEPAVAGQVPMEEVTVTGSRITSSAFNAPTPTSMVDAEQLAANAQPNIFTTVAQLPSLQGSTGTSTNTFSTSSGQQGLSSFSLRGLGPIRTLTLLDGQRVVAANVTGVPDVSLFPQLLIKRVDVVNGGASSSYGSDAVGGVVNFITDTRFEGVKGNVQGAITNYDDDETILAQFAAGRSFLAGRLHVVASGEYHDEKGVGPGEYGIKLAGGRDWFKQRTLVNRNVLNDGSPQYMMVNNAQPFQYTKYGLITAGPLQGTAFDQAGNPFQFEYGSNGTPSGNASGAVNGCYSSYCVGGDLSGNVDAGRTLQSSLDRVNSYSRISYDLAENSEIYLTANIGRVRTQNQPVNGMNRPGLTIQCDNAYLPASIKSACADAGITQFQYGTSNAILPSTQVHTDRRQYRFVLGAMGEMPIFGSGWKYDGYYEHGVNLTDVDVDSIMLSRHFNQAIQATTLDGSIVCADPVARANGCVPVNIFGGTQPSAAALEYILPKNGPEQRTRQTQDVVSFNLSGAPIDLWAGPLSVAVGAEYRREYYRVRADAYGNGINTQAGIPGTPYNDKFPADPVLLDTGNNWYAGNYKNGTGSYSVNEAFLEFDLPLFESDGAGRANLNAAARITDYSTSGTLGVWKLGTTWDTPIDGLRLRGTTSRDVRAPNLSELYAAPVTTTLPNFFDPFTNTNVLVIKNQIGNVNLSPETARNTSFGVVLANPEWLPGASFSIDYYKIEIKDVISTLAEADIVNYCYTGSLPQTCDAFNLHNESGPNFVNVQSFNLASIKTDGFDIEASYRWQQPLGMDGTFTLRGLATHIRRYLTDSGLPGTIPIDTAGVNVGSTPDWKVLAIQSYDAENYSLQIQQRWISDGVYANNYIECQAGSCPVATATAPTINDNHMDEAFYLDVGGSYKISSSGTAYFKVDNVLNEDPPPSPFFVNPALYDVLGRVYRIGFRFSL